MNQDDDDIGFFAILTMAEPDCYYSPQYWPENIDDDVYDDYRYEQQHDNNFHAKFYDNEYKEQVNVNKYNDEECWDDDVHLNQEEAHNPVGCVDDDKYQLEDLKDEISETCE